MHTSRVEIAKPWLTGFMLAVDEVLGGPQKFFVNRFHSLCIQRPGVFDPLPAHTAVLHVLGGIVFVRRPAAQYAARSESLSEFGILRIVGILWLFLGIE